MSRDGELSLRFRGDPAAASASPCSPSVAAPAAHAQDTGTYTSAPLDWGAARPPGSTSTATARPTTAAVAGVRADRLHRLDRHRLRRHLHLRHRRRRLPGRPHVGRRQRRPPRRLLPAGRRRRQRLADRLLALDRHRLHRRPATRCRRGAPPRRSRTPTATAPPTTAGSPAPTRTTPRLLANAADSARLRCRGRPGPRTGARGSTSPATARPTSAASPSVLACTVSIATARAASAPRHRPRLRARPRLGRRQRRRQGRLLPPRRQRRRRRAASAARSRPAAASARTSPPRRWSGATTPATRGSTSTATATVTSAAPSRRRATNQQLFCTLWTPTGLAATRSSPARSTSAADGRAWVDHNGDGRADYCRRVGGGADTRVACTISNGTAFGPLPARPARPPRRSRRPCAGQEDADRRHARLRLLHQGPLDPPHPARRQPRPEGATVKATCKKGCSRKSYTKKNVRGGKLSLKTADPQAPEGGDDDQGGRLPDREARRRPRPSASAPGSGRRACASPPSPPTARRAPPRRGTPRRARTRTRRRAGS